MGLHGNSSTSTKRFAICLALAALTLAVYFQVTGFDFIHLDDPGYVVDNKVVRQGISLETLRWAFSSFHESNWHPLTWVSHMVDVELFGMNPGMHHLTSVLIHVLNTVLLFVVLDTMTGAVWKSAGIAALFALHPLHVESVAWVSERKDVLCALFWMLTMAAYLGYVGHRTVARYLLMSLCFVLGLMAKPMIVTLPFVLLLLDFWPLKRWRICTPAYEMTTASAVPDPVPLKTLVLEKVPLAALSLASSLVTVLAQVSGGAVKDLESVPMASRTANAAVSYVRYLVMTAWPRDLAVYYPYEGIHGPALVALCLSALVCVTCTALLMARKFPYLPVGWFWYLGTLVPVIGIVQVGSQSMADRYTYLPLIGIFIAIVWGLSDLFGRAPAGRIVLAASCAVVLTALAWSTWVQAGLWKDSETLFNHALEVTSDNYLVHYDLGYALYLKGDVKGAILHYNEALRIKPDLPQVHNNLGSILLERGDPDGAIRHYIEALSSDPHQARVHNNLGVAFMRKGRVRQAVRCFERALAEEPGYVDAARNLDRAARMLPGAGRTP